ncbi:replicative DNA helicase [Methylobacterium sp. R2-1]|uniref:replicative DNA helicase n=1 Tax=Methylobacterium sp. R2-1 TaxID=2587064 RepID=UPI00160FD2D1|nr:DnaB-like helicase C-terminal domain-containing protein [Methylobacterium sp. R2-1]MBB2964331.1 replicative DNA helicase [Methylobacterium sp. R2-1]
MTALTTTAEPLLPHALDSEQALLGAILINGDAIDAARQHVQPADFVEAVNGQIFEAMCARRDAGEPIDRRMMLAVLGNADLGGVTVGAYLGRLVTEATTVINAPGYARAIAQAARMRKVLETAQEAVTAMTDGAVRDPAAHAAHMIEALDEVASAGLAEHMRRITLGKSTAGVLARVAETRHGKKRRGVPYGVPKLDAVTLGMRPGQFIVLAGRPAMGKTLTALHIAIAAARSGGAVGMFSLEMEADELSERVLSALAYDPRVQEPITYRGIAEAKGLSDEALWRLEEAQREAARIPLWIEPQAGVTLSQIASRARQMRLTAERQGQPLAALVIDHIGLIRPSKRYSGNRVQEMTEISSGLKGLAKELSVPVLGLSQLSREVERREDKRPILSDLRDSGSIEQDADVVLGLFREAYYLQNKPNLSDDEINRLALAQNILEIEILKQRGGPTVRIECYADLACNVLAEAY